MKHYIDNNNTVFAYEADGSQDEYIKPGLTLITEEDLKILRTPSTEEQAIIDQDKINNEALAYLKSTDWYITRLTETGIVVPADILALRAEAREDIIQIEIEGDN